MRFFSALGAVVALMLGMTGLFYAQTPAYAQNLAKLLRVYAWSDTIDGRIFDAFTRETGIRVAVDVYDTSDAMEARLRANPGTYDLLIAEGTALARLVAAKALAPLGPNAPANLPGLSLDIVKAARLSDPGNALAIPYLWGSIGFGVDLAKIRALIGDPAQLGWDWLVKPEMLKRLSGCGLDLLDSPQDILPGLLKATGSAPDSRRIEDIRRAIAPLQRNRSMIQAFQPSGSMAALAAGQACIAVGLSGDVLRARQRAAGSGRPVDIGFVLPKDGTALWFDVLAIPTGAKNTEQAQALIAYLLRPDIAARVSLYSRFATSVVAARALLDPPSMTDPALYPDPSVMRRILPVSGYDIRLAPLVMQEWQRMRSAK